LFGGDEGRAKAMSEKESSKVTAVELRRVLKGTCPPEMTQAVVGDLLAEVAKDGCCTVVLNWYLHGAGDNDEQAAVEPAPCGHCIVCVSREAVKG
jgi:hypothetical protein